MDIILIAALTKEGVIGNKGTLPWDCPEEFAHFQRLMGDGPRIIGRRTFEAIRPNPKMTYFVITSRDIPGFTCTTSVKEAIHAARKLKRDINVVGGTGVYRDAFPYATRLRLSIIKGDYKGDTYFPDYDESEWKCINEEEYSSYIFKEYVRKDVDAT